MNLLHLYSRCWLWVANHTPGGQAGEGHTNLGDLVTFHIPKWAWFSNYSSQNSSGLVTIWECYSSGLVTIWECFGNF
jgi:hypothetical protein